MYCQIWRLYLFNILIQYLFLFVSSSVLPRVGNLFFGFSNESFVFSERNSDSLFSKKELSPSLFFKEQRELKCHFLKKSDWAKSSSSDSLFGIKRGKVVKNSQKHGENYTFFRANCSFFESKRWKVRFAFKKRANHSRHSLLKSYSLSSLFCKGRFERIPHGRSKGERFWAKKKKAKEQIPNPGFTQQFWNAIHVL